MLGAFLECCNDLSISVMWLNKQRKEKHTNKTWRTIVLLFFKQKLWESLGSWRQNKKWLLKTFTQYVYVWHLVPVASWFGAILLLLVSEETNSNLQQKIVKKTSKTSVCELNLNALRKSDWRLKDVVLKLQSQSHDLRPNRIVLEGLEVSS